ncbi:MAG: carbonic anhydrase [Pseudoxanthomonas sp.]|nr:carbonic anhydrase [Pseudoxanthomonas sp.]
MPSRNVVGALAIMVSLAAGAAIASEHAPHWTYQGETGPTHWSSMAPEFGACSTGHAQSPIDIHAGTSDSGELPDIQFAYHPAPLRLIDNGHTVQVDYAPGSFIEVGGHRYQLVQFHFHKPSEESIDGKHYAMVAHLVHKDSDGRLAVVAVPLAPGAANPMVATLWKNLPARKEAEVEPKGVQIDASDLLPADHDYYTYMGSLTTPPCSEGVTWFVLKNPSTLSASEIGRFAAVYPMNARPVQPLNGRVVQASD